MINISTEILSTHKSSFGDLQKYLGGTMKVPVGLEYDGGGRNVREILRETY